jgi:cell division protein FtsQ
MAGMVSVSRADLAQRRQQLRRQRQVKIFKALWRTLAVTGLASGLWWGAIQPIWVLKTPKQIEIKSGQQVLPESVIRSLLALSYPQSLWRIEPSAIATTLQKQPAIAEATVNRRLFPPGLIIEIQERVPVAVAQMPMPEKSTTNNKSQNKNSLALIDEIGEWIPLEKYTALNPNIKLPSLKVIGSATQCRPHWNQIYAAITQSSIPISEVNCQNPSNLIVKTNLGNVHLGLADQELPQKIQMLAKMSSLPTKMNLAHIDYIDLKNTDYPTVQMNSKFSKSGSQDGQNLVKPR